MARKHHSLATSSEQPFPLSRHRLANGMPVWCQPRPASTSVVALVAIRAGSRHENRSNNGISHFLEHMVFTGTERWNEEEIKEVITRRGGEWNGWTGIEDTMYYAHVSAEDLDTALDWLAQVVFHATLPADKIAKERQVIFQERWGRYGWIINTLDRLGFGYELDRDVRRALFPGSSLGLRIAGEDDSLEHIDRAALLRYYRQRYVPANTALVVVGNVIPDQVVERAASYFSAIEPGEPPPPLPAPATVNGTQRVVVRGPMPTDQVRLMIGARTVGRTHPDHWALDVLAEFLEQSLTEAIRYRRGLVYGLQAYNVTFDETGYFVIATSAERDHRAEIVDIVEAHLERVQSGDIEPDKVAEARVALKGRWALSMEDNLERATWLAQWVWLTPDDGHVRDYAAQVDAVTTADLSRVARTYFAPERRYVGVHEPAVTVKSGARALGVAAGVSIAAWLARRLLGKRAGLRTRSERTAV
jgi:predicted Zn-dependent peptidase